jgi:hypothetical protein
MQTKILFEVRKKIVVTARFGFTLQFFLQDAGIRQLADHFNPSRKQFK